MLSSAGHLLQGDSHQSTHLLYRVCKGSADYIRRTSKPCLAQHQLHKLNFIAELDFSGLN